MPVEIIDNFENWSLFRIQTISAMLENGKYRLNMNPGSAAACVVGISRNGPIPASELLQLSKESLDRLWHGQTLEFEEKGYTLRGVSKGMVAAGEYGSFQIAPPFYLQVWAMTTVDLQGKILLVPSDPSVQMIMVPVTYRLIKNGNEFKIDMPQATGYCDGDLMYRVDIDHLPIPIPKEGINTFIPLNRNLDNLTVFPDDHAEGKYVANARNA